MQRVLFHHQASPGLRAELEALAARGLEVVVVPVADRAGLAAALPGTEILWHVLEPVTAALLEAAPRLRLVQKIGVGVNTIDLEAAGSEGFEFGTQTRARLVMEQHALHPLAARRRVAPGTNLAPAAAGRQPGSAGVTAPVCWKAIPRA